MGLSRADEPTLEQPEVGIPYRSTYLAFGLEGVRSDTTSTSRKELLQQILYWTVDRPTLTLNGPTEAQSSQEVSFSAAAQSNTPTSFGRYRWDFGDGTPIGETSAPTTSHRYTAAGSYTLRVEATNSWGHRALSSQSITITAGTGMGSTGSTSPAPVLLKPLLLAARPL